MSDSIVLKVAMARSQSEAGYGRARMDGGSRRALGVELGDTVEIAGKRSVVAKVFKCDPEDEGRGMLFIDGLTRTNAGVSVDENVTVRRCIPQPAEQITLAPNIPDGKRIKFESGIENVFLKGLMNRPLMADTDIIVPNIALMGNRSTFTVVSTTPKGAVIVNEKTRIVVKDTPKKQQTAKVQRGHQITYDDVGGLDEELRRIREMIELPLKHPELFERLGIGAPKGVLLYGPPGTGKTLMAEAVANESGAALFSVRGPEIIGQYYGQSEERLREIFKEAAENAPSIVFLDEIDSIAPNRNDVYGEVERRVVAQLLTLMDGLDDRGNVIVIGATNREDSIDPALRRPGRFDREIEIGIPGRKSRADILSVHLRDMPLTPDVTPEKLASLTQGFVGADLAALCREAAMNCLSSRMNELDLDKAVPAEILESMKVSMDDFTAALGDVEPSGMREVLVEIPKVSWEDVGGLDDVRRRIEEVFVPEEGNGAYDRLGIEPGKGILLYGPPGTGKTLIAKALANESGTNFISVNGPEMASKWMGESERAIRQIFKRAKQMAPCIIFFDELDSIAPVRGMGDGSAWERVVAQMLTSMDGVEGLRNVTVMGATNRPDMVDPALLRPGRFDRLILVGKPDADSRLGILKVHTRRMPLGDVDLAAIAAMTDGYVGADLAAV
ncbi:MAG: AAA family ATPase, partial [Candidatus Methanoprimaticola hominis]